MKEYKYTINGTKYEVAVGDIEENIVTVTVNGEEYKVEMELPAEPEKKKPVLGKAAAAPAEGEPASAGEKLLRQLEAFAQGGGQLSGCLQTQHLASSVLV